MESRLERSQVHLKEQVLPIKKTFGYRQRDEKKRKDFIERVSSYHESQIIYLDETGIRKNEAIEYGYAPKGEKLYDLRDSSKNKAFNVIAALKNKKIIAPFVFEGSCNSDVFNAYLRNILKPILVKGDVIVLDNASFHKSSIIKDIAKECECKVEYLPPYSPDLNSIEEYWHSIKARLRRAIKNTNATPIETIREVFMGLNRAFPALRGGNYL